MSGPAIHHIVAKETLMKMKKTAKGADLDFLHKVETEWAPYLRFGCQGPDPLFFNLKDMSPDKAKYVKTFLEVVDFIEDFKDKLRALIPEKVKEAAEKLQEVWDDVEQRSALLTEISQTLGETNNLATLLGASLVEAGKKYLTDATNLFDKFLTHPIQDKGKYAPGGWWWFDTLHYRKSGQYALQLLKNAKPHSPQMAYAIGYLTHFSSDVVGHPFVNIVSGGPYRTHAQRHKFIENHQDVYAWEKYFNGQEFVQSKAGEGYIIDGNERNLPEDFNAFILKTMQDVYQSDDLHYGAPMNRTDLDDTYWLWLKWFRGTTNSLDIPKPIAYSLTKEIKEVWEKFEENIGDIWDNVKEPFKGKKSIWSFFKSLLKAALSSFAFGLAITDYILGNIATLGAAPLRYMLSAAYSYFYDSYMQFHQGVVLNGLAFPFNKQLQHFAALHTTNAGIADVSGLNASSIKPFFPLKKFKIKTAGLESHLVYPRPGSAGANDALLEQSGATPAPDAYFTADPFLYMTGELPFEKQFYEFIKDFTEATHLDTSQGFVGKFKNEAFDILRYSSRRGGLGNAVDLSTFLFSEFTKGNAIPDLNLDGDRGYAFPCWRRVQKKSDLNNKSVLHTAVEDAPEFAKHNVLDTETDIIHPNNDIL